MMNGFCTAKHSIIYKFLRATYSIITNCNMQCIQYLQNIKRWKQKSGYYLDYSVIEKMKNTRLSTTLVSTNFLQEIDGRGSPETFRAKLVLNTHRTFFFAFDPMRLLSNDESSESFLLDNQRL